MQDYVGRVKAGGIDPVADILVTQPAPALRHIDGQSGLGPAIARRALDEAMEAARASGIGAAFVYGASHLGALAPYLYIAAEAGFAAVMTTNTAPMIAPAGGRKPIVGNNPLGLVVPHPDGRHVLVDMALSVVSRSRVRAAANEGAAIPKTWATDAAGQPTTDPVKAMQGLMRAIGGDKGASLALCLDLLAGVLSGAAFLNQIPAGADQPDRQQNLGQMFILIDVGRLLPDDILRRRMDDASQIVGQVQPVDPAYPARMPGARALACLQMAHKTGLDLPQRLLSDLQSLAG